MTDQSNYGGLKALFVILCVGLIIAAIVRSVNSGISEQANNYMQPVTTPPSSTKPTAAQANPAPRPAKPAYKITPTPPSTGAFRDFSVALDECHRPNMRQIVCTGRIANTTDAPARVYLYDSVAEDDVGNAFQISTYILEPAFFFGDKDHSHDLGVPPPPPPRNSCRVLQSNLL